MPCSEMVRRGRAFGEQGYYYEALECFEAGAEWDPYSPVQHRNSLGLTSMTGTYLR